jgi:hypothetical protein
VITTFFSKTDALHSTLRVKPTSSLNAATAQENTLPNIEENFQPTEAYIKLKFNFGVHRHSIVVTAFCNKTVGL